MKRALALALLSSLTVGCSGSDSSNDIGEWEGTCTLGQQVWEVEVGIVDVYTAPGVGSQETEVVGWGALLLGEDARYAGELSGSSLYDLRFPFLVDDQKYRVSLSALASGQGTREGTCELESSDDLRSGELVLTRSD